MTFPTGITLLGVNMLFVAFVLYIIALNLAGKVGGKETAAMCILVGGLNTVSALYNGLILGDTGSMAGNLLFGFTYLFFAMDILWESDTFTGLGNYALCVAVTTIPFIGVNIGAGAFVLAFYWILWGQLWAGFWIANGLQKNIAKGLTVDTFITAALNLVGAIGFLFGWLDF